MKKKYVILLHLLFWLYYIMQDLTVFDFKQQKISFPILAFDFNKPEYLLTLSFTAIYIFVFYLNYLVFMPKFFDVKNVKRIVLSFLALFIIFIGMRYLIEEVLFDILFGFHNYYKGVTVTYYIYDNLAYSSLPIMASSVLWFIVNMLRLQKEQLTLLESKRETEINFLKSQINPHFIFNTLNNIYYLVFEKSEKALPAVEQLSGLMRYMTYESQNETIALQREIAYIDNFIALETMRISGDAQVVFKKNIENPECRIPPLLLIPFVENGFKHGIVNNPENPFTIELTQNKNHLILQTQNTINNYKKDHQSGVGIENIKKRLQLYFPDRHSLEITTKENMYYVKLDITL
ncbi:MAG: hypothetical protein BGO88_08625 [Flavobacterium sp. 38-13]|uniref:sensor histidine kinase n=1 Tax=Flavobacterium sp. 38-13 TaxID=1896168 RepID=UPI0009628BFA|nr:histidine kinase [Flavobacterium sp. 38-13]OJX49806.1 MAG: hypothetical protein BGO88_08625 [Flavobacterium sp. 38-13]